MTLQALHYQFPKVFVRLGKRVDVKFKVSLGWAKGILNVDGGVSCYTVNLTIINSGNTLINT